MVRWWIAQVGLFLSVFALVAPLSGPGLIDIVDGLTRYEVARSLVDHGVPVIRDPEVWFTVFPGRHGKLYSKYRFPQSVIGVAAILAADATGPVREDRRHFFFTLTGAIACALLAVTYAALFRGLGHAPRAALLWAAGGIFCTPSWFYGTSTFDDILGSATVVLAMSTALSSRRRHPLAGATVSGLALGLAFNCKEPLGIFVIPVLTAIYDPELDLRSQWGRLAMVAVLMGAGVAVYMGYDLYKFPPGSTAGHAEILKKYAPIWSGSPEIALIAMTISLSAGAPFYNPPIAVCLSGLRAWWSGEKLFCWSLTGAIAVFILFISLLTFFKGDPAWGPRYLTPVFALLWIFAPVGSRHVRRWVIVAALGLGLVVQLGALCIDHHRLYIEHGLPSSFYVSNPGLYFHPAISHLINRPREIAEVLSSQGDRAGRYSPSPTPTFAFPVIDFVEKGPAAIRMYHVLNGFRFWWASFQYLDRRSRPIEIKGGVVSLVLITVAGLLMQVGAPRKSIGRVDPELVQDEPCTPGRSALRVRGRVSGTLAVDLRPGKDRTGTPNSPWRNNLAYFPPPPR